MKLYPHQQRVLEWLADPKNSRRAADIAAATGHTIRTVTQARTTLTALGLIKTVVEVTDAGKELLGGGS